MSSKKQKEATNKVGNKAFGIQRLTNSIKYSFEGLDYAYHGEQSTRMHALSFVIVVIIGFLLRISFNQWALVVLSSMFILSIELINTAIEAIVDMYTTKFNPLAKIAKDCGSAAAFIASLAHIAICLFVFGDKLISIIG